MEQELPDDIQEYLNKIKRTVAESEAAIASAQLRIEETDRLLAANGLTREDILKWRPTGEQRLAVNEILRANGLPPIEEDDAAFNFDVATERVRTAKNDVPVAGAGADGDVTAQRQKKFDSFMRDYRL